jgi:HAMP domain-containing protein
MSMRLSEYNAQSGKNALSFHVENISDLITQLLAEASLRTFSTIRAPAPEDIRQYSPLISSSLESFPARAKNAGISIRSVNLFLKNGSVFTPNQAALPFYDYNGALDYFQSKGFSMAEGYTRTFWSLVNISGEVQPAPACVSFIYSAGTLEKLGVAIFIFDNADLYNSYSAFTENGLVVNNQGIILISPNPAQGGSAYDEKTFVQKIMKLPDAGSILTQNATGSELILSYYPVMNQSGYLVVPFDFYSGTMQQEMSTYLASTLFLTVLGIVCSFLLSLFLSRGLTRTIVALSTFIKRVDNGQSKLRYHSKNKDEISMIGESVNEMLDKLKLAADLREEDLIVQQQLELSLMQLQINPHLLYNTLESVLWSLEHDKSKDAAMSIASLSEFFKISLSRGNMIIPLRDELQLIRHYVISSAL